MSYKVTLESFEGPFDLLVYLIENAEMNIYDIEISEITSQYLTYLHEMEERDINIASEFMVLAASLIEIKSKMILPRISEDGETEIMEDPRKELVSKLVEYKKFKAASSLLQQNEERGLNIFAKPQEDISIYLENPDEILSMDESQFTNAFNLFLQRKQRIEQIKQHYTRVEREKASIQSRITSIIGKLRKKLTERFNFKDLVEQKNDKYDTIVTFVSVLEMAKERVVNVEQEKTFGDIEVSAGERINEEVTINAEM